MLDVAARYAHQPLRGEHGWFYVPGAAIDDHCAAEVETAAGVDSHGRHALPAHDHSTASERFATAHLEYLNVGLHRHEGKAFRRQPQATIWGGHLDGCVGW